MLKNRFKRVFGKLQGLLSGVKSNQRMAILAAFVGVLAGLAAVVIKFAVHSIQDLLVHGFSTQYHNILYVAYPAVGILIAVLFVKFILKRTVGHGIPRVLYAISKENGILPKHNMFSSVVTSAFTVGFGGSVGLEGPIVGTGAALGSNVARIFKLNYKQRTLLLTCAAAGAMAAIFKAPLTAIVFALEIMMLDLTMASIVPLLITSVTAVLTSYFFMGQQAIYTFELKEAFALSQVPYFVIFGIIGGLLSAYFTKVYMFFHALFDKMNNVWVKLFVGGISLGLIVFFLPSLYGEGYEATNLALEGKTDHLFANSLFYNFSNSMPFTLLLLMAILLMKVVATSLTFGAGGVGGIFAPALYIGANFGLLFALALGYFGIVDLPLSNFALVGMGSLIAGILHAPLMAVFMIAELTGGFGLLMPLMIVAVISYAVAKYFNRNSVYTIQLAKRKELITHHKDKALLTLMKVEKLIETNFIAVKETDTLGDLVKAVSKSKRNIFPVLDKNQLFKGVIVLDDVRNVMFDREKYHTVFVNDLMVVPSEHVSPNDSMEDVAKKIQKTGRFNLVVLDNGKYKGFVSRANVFSEYRTMLKEFSEH